MMVAADATEGRSPVLRGLDAIDRTVEALCRGMALSTGLGLLFLISVGVGARYVVHVGGIDWAEELPKQVFPWFIMSGVVLAVRGGNHIAVDLIMSALSPALRTALVVFINVVIAVAYVMLCKTAFDLAIIAAAEINPVLGTPGSLPFYALAIGSLLTAIGAASIAVRVFILGADAAPQGRPEDSVQ